MYQVEKLEEEQAKQKEQAQKEQAQKEQRDGEEVWVVRRDFHGLGCFCLFVAVANQVS